MAASEVVIRSAERARLQSLVDEFGSEGEQNCLLISGWRDGVPDPELLARLARRVERRARFGLPPVECGGDPPTHGCTCLELGLDAAGGGSRRAILRRAAAFHWSPPPRTGRAESEDESSVAPGAQEANEDVELAQVGHMAHLDVPEVVPKVPPPKPAPAREPQARFFRRSRKWFDPPDGPSGFADMKF